jgi:hypothetical protein
LRTDIKVKLPLETPLANIWYVSFFLDSVSIAGGSGQLSGFSIVPMAVTLKGNNLLSVTSPAYFSLVPSRSVAVGASVHIIPPSDQGYIVACYPIILVNFPALPQCGVSPVSGALVLTLSASAKSGGGRLNEGEKYIVGVGVTNAARIVPAVMNFWTVIIYDSAGNIQDSSYQVAGANLRGLRITSQNQVLRDSSANGELRVVIPVTLTHGLASGAVSEFRVVPPQRFQITGNSWKSSLPISEPISLSGKNLTVALADSAIPIGAHHIELSGKLAESGDPDTTWMLQGLKGQEIVYQHVLQYLS